MSWIPTQSQVRSFQWDNDPELIHIIKHGFNNTYLIIDEDGYSGGGNVTWETKESIKEKYNIDIN
jgi:hypothetical protein